MLTIDFDQPIVEATEFEVGAQHVLLTLAADRVQRSRDLCEIREQRPRFGDQRACMLPVPNVHPRESHGGSDIAAAQAGVTLHALSERPELSLAQRECVSGRKRFRSRVLSRSRE